MTTTTIRAATSQDVAAPSELLVAPRAGFGRSGAVRGVLTISGPPAHDEVLIHSVVVAATHRGQGLGGLLMAHLEDEARRRRKTSATLQVVRANTGAQDFYRSLGYTEYPRPVGPITRRLAYPSVMMRKTLLPPRDRPRT